MKPITVADLVAECATLGVEPSTTVLLLERDWPVVVTEADGTVMWAPDGVVMFGFLLFASDEDE